MSITPADLAALIDHTILKPDATDTDIIRFCDEARRYRFKSVCVNASFATLASQQLAESGIATCVVVGFPLGATTASVKADEAAAAIADGAREIDMVMAIGALKGRHPDQVRDDMAAVRAASRGAVLKVIIETCLLSESEKKLACRLAIEAEADFVKTSTGFLTGGATVEDVALMRAAVGERLGVKASGGVRTRAVALALIAAGATRLGTSSGVALMTEAAPGEGY